MMARSLLPKSERRIRARIRPGTRMSPVDGKGKVGKVSKDSTGEPIEGPGFERRYGETEGYTIGFERYAEHADIASLFTGLPGPIDRLRRDRMRRPKRP